LSMKIPGRPGSDISFDGTKIGRLRLITQVCAESLPGRWR
jgi:hypothetical protein